MSNRGINLHCFPCDIPLLLRRERLERAHIVETVGKLDDNHSDILVHCNEHLSQVFRLMLLPRRISDFSELCHTVYERCNNCAETFNYFGQLYRCILNNVVQQRRNNALGIHTELNKYTRNRDGMHDVGLTGLARLLGVSSVRKQICILYDFHVVFLVALVDNHYKIIVSFINRHFLHLHTKIPIF